MGELTYDFCSKQPANSPGTARMGPRSVMWLRHNTLRPRQDGRHFPDDTFKCIFFNENVWISLKNSLKFVPKVHIINILALVQIMAWPRPGDKPSSEPMMFSLLTHICITQPQWVILYISWWCLFFNMLTTWILTLISIWVFILEYEPCSDCFITCCNWRAFHRDTQIGCYTTDIGLL